MDRQTAERLMAAALALDPALGEIDSAISQVRDEGERKALARSLGNIFREVYEGFIVPISREYPDLAEEA